MTAYVAMLRAVNVGGAKVSMADLKQIGVDAGYDAVSTHLNSGNLLFSSNNGTAAEHAAAIAAALQELVGRPVPVVVRTPAELQRALDGAQEHFGGADQARVAVAFLDRSAGEGPADRLGEWASEEYVIDDDVVYLHYPQGQADTKLTITVIEKKLGVRGTARGVKTVAGLIKKSS